MEFFLNAISLAIPQYSSISLFHRARLFVAFPALLVILSENNLNFPG